MSRRTSSIGSRIARARSSTSTPPNGTQAVSQLSACYASQILQENVKSGTGTRARLNQQPAAGKTGTTNENADAWFVGFTPYLTTAVWMGNPTFPVSMENLNGVANFGGTYPAMIWKAYNDPVHDGLPVVQFPDCPKPLRFPQIVIGQGNPFLNGWRFGSSPSANTQRRSSGSGSKTTTTTTPASNEPPVTSPPSTAATTPVLGRCPGRGPRSRATVRLRGERFRVGE